MSDETYDDPGDTASSNAFDLVHLVSPKSLQELQDQFSALGRATVCICTLDGGLITKPTWGSRFSELIGQSPRGAREFAEGILQTAKGAGAGEPYTCHEGMTVHATPITHDQTRLGTIVVGTRQPKPPTHASVDVIAAKYSLDPDELWKGTLRGVRAHLGGDPDAVQRFARSLAATIATLYDQARQIRRQLADLRTVYGLAELLAGTSELQEILNATVKRVVEVMPVKACAIRLLDAETGELVLKAVHNLSEEYQRKGPVMIHENAVDSAAFAGEAVQIEDSSLDPRIRYPEEARREGIVSALCVSLTYRGRTIGVIRVYTSRRHRFSAAEESLLRSIGSHAAAAIINSRLYEQDLEAKRVRRQVEAAAAIQRRMLPSRPPDHPGLEFGCVYDPTLEVGGDFYDFIKLPDGKLGLCVADVVGKGLPAAMMMASVRSALRAHAAGASDVQTVIRRVNQHMYRETLVSEFATLVYGVFSADGRAFAYCNAGHLPPLLLRGDEFIELEAGGLVIGVAPDETFQSEVVQLDSGDILTFVTDGVTEAMNFDGVQYAGERLLASIRKHRSLDAGQLAQQLLWDVRRFVGLATQSDDITIVVTKMC